MSGGNSAASQLRRRLLNRMGIEVWYPRTTVPGGVAVESATGVADIEAEAREQAVVGSPVGREEADRQVAETGSTRAIAMGTGDPTAPGVSDEVPFAVDALGLPGALLVANAFSRGGETTLAKDVLRAARRDWSAAVGQARFDWPQPGVAGASAPALAAFVEKQAENFDAKLVLVAESAAPRLGDCAFEFVRVPDMASLADPRNKRLLWRRLQGLTG